MNSYKIKPKFPEDDGVRFPEELAKESAEHLKKAGYDASVVDKYYVQVNGDIDESELSRWGTIMNSRIIKSNLLKVPAEEWAQKWIPNIMDQKRFVTRCNEDGYTEFDAETFYDLIEKYGFRPDGSSGYMYIKSARYIATDPESGEVLGSADTYEEAVNEWGEDVTITDSEVAEGEGNMDTGLFSNKKVIKSSNLPEEVYYIVVNGSKQYYNTYNDAEKDLEYLRQYGNGNVGGVYTETDPEEIAELVEVGYIKSSNKPTGDKAFLSKVVSAFCAGTMTEEQAIKRVMLRNNCNIGYARQILSNAMDDASLIQSGTMEIAEDLNKDFNVDGDIESWSEDYVPQAGKASTIGGEILRATAQIVNRFYNDGDKIGIGNGKETVNPAARYLYNKVLDSSTEEVEQMLNGESDINLSDESYEEWIDGYKDSIENYLRNNEELFHTPNKDDMWDFKSEDDEKTSVTDIFIEDDDGNRYSFQGGPEGWHCYDIYFADGPKYNVGDFVNSGDIQAAGGDTSEEFVTFNIDGYTYSAELYNNDEYEITDIESSNQLVHKDEEWTTEDLEKYQIYDSSNGSELSIEDLY